LSIRIRAARTVANRGNIVVPRWINTIARFFTGVLSFAGFMTCWVLSTSWLTVDAPRYGLGLMLAVALVPVAILVHELGHYAAARLAGMTVLSMNVFGLELHAQRRGWRVAWSRSRLTGINGYVFAVHSPDQPMRPQMLRMLVGGPAANFAIAALCGATGWLTLPGSPGYLALAFGALNLVGCVANLIPQRSPAASDGLALYQWLRTSDESAADLALMRSLSRLVFGQTSAELPEAELATLESQPVHLPIIALWFRFKANQERGEWAASVARADRLGELVAALDPPTRTALSELLTLMRIELAFSRAMLTGEGAWLENGRLTPKARRQYPWLRLRCEALAAALRGDTQRCTQLLQLSRQQADNSVDGSLVKSERMLRDAVAAVASERARRLPSQASF
jgi:Zn-dependent protease